MNIRAKSFSAFTAIAALALSACAPETSVGAPLSPPLEGATIGGEFALTSEDGETVRWTDFDGQYRIVYFGYAYCPDACPTDVQRTMQGFAQFEQSAPELAAKVQPIFISVDPERDTPEVLTQFTDAFSERMIGLTGTEEQIADVASKFSVYYTKFEANEEGGYLMDHSRISFLFGPDGEPISMLPHDQGADAVEAELALWVS
ncbi:SCO family protein [uncultured Erythrobacter sp.]|uniref:SCO family protein n=1 Tax=uncultured Erythrobacter sp. TaxID=263913 RepID=UPI0026066944|nr:SCO family protein [uncultured Erythrobacter sp.]